MTSPKPRALREMLGISIRDAAVALDYDKGALSRLETGGRQWTLRFAAIWLDYMDVEIDAARKAGAKIPANALPTLHELAALGPNDSATRRRRKGGRDGSSRAGVRRKK